MEPISMVTDMREFFLRQIRDALRNQSVAATPEAEFYLVELLAKFSQSQQLFQQREEKLEQDTLFELLDRAFQADPESRIVLLRRLGDIALYFSGYFPESVSRKLIDLNYYIQMGETAYGSVSTLCSRRFEQDLYQELAQKFESWMEVLSEVSASGQTHRQQDLLRLYENWLDTGSRVAERLLHKNGFVLASVPPKAQ